MLVQFKQSSIQTWRFSYLSDITILFEQVISLTMSHAYEISHIRIQKH